jgi:outer membrane immunogenic protein
MRAKLWGVLVAVAAGAGVANAADLAVPVYKAPVYKAPVVVSDWSGFYIGVHGGYGWGDPSYVAPPPAPNNEEELVAAVAAPPAPHAVSVKQNGGIFGGHIGYNWQFGCFVAGVEGDIDGADITGTDPAGPITFKTNELASIRGRLGYTVTPDLLAYGTGGAGWTSTDINAAGVTDTLSKWGWVAGGGLEYKFFGHWIARAEYLHYGIDASATVNGFTVNEKSIDVVRGGLSYKF